MQKEVTFADEQPNEKITKESQIATNRSEIYAWGNDTEGQLGISDYSYASNYTDPRYMRYSVNVCKLACGSAHTLLLSETGKVYVMGSNQVGQLGLVN